MSGIPDTGPDNPFAPPRPFRPYPPPVAPARPLNRLAVAAFVTGLLGLAPLALPLGFLALRRRPGRRRGRGLAWAGIAVSLLWIATLAIAVGWAVSQVGPHRDAAGAVVSAGRVLPDDVRIGDCVRSLGTARQVGPLVLVPCAGPDGGQVFAAFDLPASGWPGEPAVRRGAETGCAARYATAGRQDVASEIWFLYPTGATRWWLGDHRVVCLVVPQRPR